VATQWKAEQEAQKKDGNIVSYKVMSVEGHTPGEWNLAQNRVGLPGTGTESPYCWPRLRAAWNSRVPTELCQ